jgi:hypothetical protein
LRQQKLVQCFVVRYAELQRREHANTELVDRTKCHSNHPKHKLQLSLLLAQKRQRDYQPQCLRYHEVLKANCDISGLGHHQLPGLQLRISDSQEKQVMQRLDQWHYDPEQQQLLFHRSPKLLRNTAQLKLPRHRNQL